MSAGPKGKMPSPLAYQASCQCVGCSAVLIKASDTEMLSAPNRTHKSRRTLRAIRQSDTLTTTMMIDLNPEALAAWQANI